MIAYHYHYQLDYIGTLDIEEIDGLLNYLKPPEQQHQQAAPAPTQEERLAEKLEKFNKIKEEEARQKSQRLNSS